ncbi:hypothetical protein [Providencia stuartii]|uniref:hypothetical protein n=1 Tax=Providencia stuartii TaxID=588 RepID=UPI003337DC5A
MQTEHFRYDEAANLFKDRQQSALHNQVHHSDQFDYQYDGFGRMVSRCEKGSTSGQHYHYDAENRIIAVDIHQGPLGYERAEYRYDILGRRIEKRLWKASAIANTITYPPVSRMKCKPLAGWGWCLPMSTVAPNRTPRCTVRTMTTVIPL